MFLDVSESFIFYEKVYRLCYSWVGLSWEGGLYEFSCLWKQDVLIIFNFHYLFLFSTIYSLESARWYTIQFMNFRCFHVDSKWSERSFLLFRAPAFIVPKILAVVSLELIRDISINFHIHIANFKFKWRFGGAESKDVSVGVNKLVIFSYWYSLNIRYLSFLGWVIFLWWNRQIVQNFSLVPWMCWGIYVDMSWLLYCRESDIELSCR